MKQGSGHRASGSRGTVACHVVSAYVMFIMYGFTREQRLAYTRWFQPVKNFIFHFITKANGWRKTLLKNQEVSRSSRCLRHIRLTARQCISEERRHVDPEQIERGM